MAYHARIPYRDRMLLNLTARCNSKCLYCEVSKLDPRDDLPTERIKRLIREARRLGTRSITLSGGEPFLHHDFWDIVGFAHGLGLKVDVLTNGLLLARLSDDRFDDLDQHLHGLTVSLDSADSTTHDHLRGVSGAWERTTQGLRRARERLPHVSIQTATVVTWQNVALIPELIRLGHSLGLDQMRFQPVNTETNYPGVAKRDKDGFVPPADEVREVSAALEEGFELATRLGVQTNLYSLTEWADSYFLSKDDRESFWFTSALPRFTCVEPFTCVFVASNGDLQPCALLPACGNVRDAPLKDELAKLREIKSRIKKERFPPECRACSCAAAGMFALSALLHPIRNRSELRRLVRRSLQ